MLTAVKGEDGQRFRLKDSASQREKVTLKPWQFSFFVVEKPFTGSTVTKKKIYSKASKNGRTRTRQNAYIFGKVV